MSHSGYNRVYFATTSVHSERSPTEKEAAVKDFAAGSLVRHQTLGTGKVVAVEPTALHVFFPASDTRYAAKLRWPTAGSFLSRDDLDRDPWLEGLTSFAMDSASGRYALAANFISQDEAVAAYLAEHPGAFQVTTAATPRSGPSRGARWRSACAEWVSVMGEGQAEKLLEDGRYEELARRAARVAARAATIPGMIETEVLAEAFETGDVVRHFFEALFGFLSVPAPARARFDRLSAAALALGVPSDAAWPMATFFPFVARPSHHMVLLHRSACAGAGRLGCDLQYQGMPTWATYGRLRDLSTRLLAKLGPSGARDNVDVECFLHATGTRRPAAAVTKRAMPGHVAAASKAARAAPAKKKRR
jgi:hypothetical protein